MANTKVQSEQIANDAVVTSHIADSIGLGGSPTTTTQSASDNSTKIATTAYVDAAFTALVDSSPAALNTLNELAAALGDDANFSTTVTNSIADKLPLSGGAMTGAITTNSTFDGRDVAADGVTADAALPKAGGTMTGALIGTTARFNGTTTAGLVISSSSTASSGFKIYNNSSTDTANLNNHFSGSMVFSTANTERMRIDSSGNVGIGVTSPQGNLDIGTTHGVAKEVALRITNADYPNYGWDIWRDNTTGHLNFAHEDAGTDSTRVTFKAQGSVGIGTTDPDAMLEIVSSDPRIRLRDDTAGGGADNGGQIEFVGYHAGSGDGKREFARIKGLKENGTGGDTKGYLSFWTNDGSLREAARFNSAGNLLIGTSSDVGVASGGLRLTFPSNESDGDLFFVSNGGGSNATPVLMYVVSGESFSSNHGAMAVGRHTGNNRSINAGGTVNASGNDYAEYMVKSSGCGDIAKGEVVGVDADGKLTKKFSEAKSFVIKSTDPSYVGGDTWWTEKEPEPKYTDDTKSTKTDDFKDWETRMETARGTVDRVAFSGQVPVNITGSFNVGDYVYPQVNSSGIKAVAKASPTFEEYQLCVGKIWTTMDDGRPLVAVKIG